MSKQTLTKPLCDKSPLSGFFLNPMSLSPNKAKKNITSKFPILKGPNDCDKKPQCDISPLCWIFLKTNVTL